MKEDKKLRNEDSFRGFYEGAQENGLGPDELDGVSGGVDYINGNKPKNLVKRGSVDEKTGFPISEAVDEDLGIIV